MCSDEVLVESEQSARILDENLLSRGLRRRPVEQQVHQFSDALEGVEQQAVDGSVCTSQLCGGRRNRGGVLEDAGRAGFVVRISSLMVSSSPSAQTVFPAYLHKGSLGKHILPRASLGDISLCGMY